MSIYRLLFNSISLSAFSFDYGLSAFFLTPIGLDFFLKSIFLAINSIFRIFYSSLVFAFIYLPQTFICLVQALPMTLIF